MCIIFRIDSDSIGQQLQFDKIWCKEEIIRYVF